MIQREADAGAELIYGAAPSVLVASDAGPGLRIIETALACLDARTLDVVPVRAVADRLERTVSLSAVVVHLADDADAADTADVLARIEAVSAEADHGVVLVAPPSLIDMAFVYAGRDNVQLLCEPDVADLIAALAMACSPRPFRLNDAGVADGSRQLVQLSEEVGRIARVLADLAETSPRPVMLEPAMFEPVQPLTSDVASAEGVRVRAMIRARRARDQFMRSELFADPAWDMLLDLMAARLEHKRVSVSSLCIAAAVPATTALRWIKSMTDEGLFVRRADNNDGRRIFIELSERAAAAMHAYLDWLRINGLAMV